MISRGLSSINQQKSSEIGLKKTFAELQIVFGIHPPYRHHNCQSLELVTFFTNAANLFAWEPYLKIHILTCLDTDQLD